MERLTYQHGNNHAVPNGFDFDFILDVDKKTADGITKILDRLAAYEDAEEQGLLVWLPEPRLPLVWGDDDYDTVLCPNCKRDLMGGYEDENTDAEYPMYQCPHCGQPIDGTMEPLTRESAEAALKERES